MKCKAEWFFQTYIKNFFINHDLYCKIDVTLFDIEWIYSIKKVILCHIFLAGDVWRCLSKDLSISLYLNCQVCKEVSPFWPVLCEKNDFKNRILKLNLNLSHIWWGLNPVKIIKKRILSIFYDFYLIGSKNTDNLTENSKFKWSFWLKSKLSPVQD